MFCLKATIAFANPAVPENSITRLCGYKRSLFVRIPSVYVAELFFQQPHAPKTQLNRSIFDFQRSTLTIMFYALPVKYH